MNSVLKYVLLCLFCVNGVNGEEIAEKSEIFKFISHIILKKHTTSTNQVFIQGALGQSCDSDEKISGYVENGLCMSHEQNGMSFSGKISCSSESESSAYRIEIFSGAQCSSSALVSASGAGSCDCTTLNYLFYSASVTVNCAGIPSTCGSEPSLSPSISSDFSPTHTLPPSPPLAYFRSESPVVDNNSGENEASEVYVKGFSGSTCSSVLTKDDTVLNNECQSASFGGVTASGKVVCETASADSAFTVSYFDSDDCSGTPITTLYGTGDCDCLTSSYGGYTLSGYVNCGGQKEVCTGPPPNVGGDEGSKTSNNLGSTDTQNSSASLSTGAISAIAAGAAVLGALAVGAYFHFSLKSSVKTVPVSKLVGIAELEVVEQGSSSQAEMAHVKAVRYEGAEVGVAAQAQQVL